MRKHRKHFEDETEVDMTPMLDIVFIMLIFFIVTTSFVKESGIVLDRPTDNKSENEQPNPHKPILIEIDEMSVIKIEGREIQPSGVRSNVENLRSKRPKALVVVQAHEKAKTGIVVSSVDQARLAGADKVTVVKPAKKK